MDPIILECLELLEICSVTRNQIKPSNSNYSWVLFCFWKVRSWTGEVILQINCQYPRTSSPEHRINTRIDSPQSFTRVSCPVYWDLGLWMLYVSCLMKSVPNNFTLSSLSFEFRLYLLVLNLIDLNICLCNTELVLTDDNVTYLLLIVINKSYNKMGCGGSTHLPRNGTGALTVYGDFFNSDTRTILSMLYIAGVPHQF